jgi:hypothetical protein
MDIRAERGERRVKQVAPHNRHDVKRPPPGLSRAVGFLMSKDLTQAPLRSIPRDRRADFSRCDDAQAIGAPIVRPPDQCHIPRRHPATALLDGLKFLPRAQADA